MEVIKIDAFQNYHLSMFSSITSTTMTAATVRALKAFLTLSFLLLLLLPTHTFAGNPLKPKERSDTDIADFDLEDGLLESHHEEDETKRFLFPGLVGNLEPNLNLEEEFDPGPFQLLPAKRKYHEMIAADLFFNLLTKFALYMILVRSWRLSINIFQKLIFRRLLWWCRQ